MPFNPSQGQWGNERQNPARPSLYGDSRHVWTGAEFARVVQ